MTTKFLSNLRENFIKATAVKFLKAGAFEVLCCFLFGKSSLKVFKIYASPGFHIADLNNNWLFLYEVSSTQRFIDTALRNCSSEGLC